MTLIRRFLRRWGIVFLVVGALVALFLLRTEFLTVLTVGPWAIVLPKGCPPDCVGADLRDKDLIGARLAPYADLSGANLSRADLTGANLRGADLSGAILAGAILEKADLSQANLQGADLKKARLVGAWLPQADLSGADLSGAILTDVDLTSVQFKAAVLHGTRMIGVNLAEVDLRGAKLSEADLRGARMRRANLTGADLTGADLSGATMVRVTLSGASLEGARLFGTNMAGATMDGVSLEGVSLNGVDLNGADLRGANLFGAELAGVGLFGAQLDDANLISARLYGVDVRQASMEDTRLWVNELSAADYEALSQDPEVIVQDAKVHGYEIDDKSVDLASGSITLYTSMPQIIADKIAADFEAKLPWLTLNVRRVETSEVVQLVLADIAESQRPDERGGADLVWVAEPSVYEELKTYDLLREYVPPDVVFMSPDLNDPEGYYYAGRLINTVIAYHESVTSPPESWEDLLDPKYKGKVGLVDPLVAGSAWPVVQALVKAYGWEYFRTLRESEPLMLPDNAAMYTELTRGNLLVGVLLDYRGREAVEAGDPIGHVWPKDGVISIPSPIAILNTARNPLAAQIFVDYVLSRDGQETMVKLGNFVPVRLDVASPPGAPPLGEIKKMPTDWKILMENREIFRERWIDIFGE